MLVDWTVAVEDGLDPRAEAARAEQAGFDAVWLAEVKHDPFLGIALAATATERVALGTSIALAFARNPMSTAATADDLMALSGGRFLLGLGTQVKAHITRRFSMPWSNPAPRMREYVLALRAIWDTWHTGAPLDFRGDFYSHTLMTPMFTPPKHPYGAPPVLLAGVGEGMTQVAGEVCDGFVVHSFTTERYLREVTLPALTRGRAVAGLDLDGFTVCGGPFIVTGHTEEEMATAAAEAKARIAFYASTPAYRAVLELHGWGALGDELHAMSRAGRWGEMGGLVDDDVLGTFAVVAEPERLGAGIAQRYGEIFTRLTLYPPSSMDLDAAAGLAATMRG